MQPLVSTKVQPVSRNGEQPLSFAQQRLWFLDQLEPGNPFYNMSAVVYMSGVLDTAALEKAINEVIRRHEVLRSTFTPIEGGPVLNTAKTLQLQIPLIELPEGERESEVQRLITEEAQRPFDLAVGPLLRATLLKTAERDHVLLLTVHHIVSDGWSTGVLMREVSFLYVAYASGRPSPLPDLPIQYADFAHWQQQWMQGEVLQKQLDYWRQQLAGANTILELPADRARPPAQTYRGASVRFELPAGLTQELNTLSRREGVTLFMVLLSAFVTLLNRYTDQDDILVGTPIANRNRSEIENLIGLFVNTLVLRAQLSREISFLELVRQMREVTLGAYAHQDIPFEKLVDEFQLEREMSRSPLFQVMFVLQNAPLGKVELPGLSLKSAMTDSGTSKFDLTLYMEESAGALVGTWEYSTDLFDESTIRRMTTHFRTLLEGVVSDPRQRVCDLPLLPEAERYQLLREFNDTEKEFPQDVRLHELIEQQVARTPEQVALVFEEEKVSYRELNERANQLAHHLRSLGVGPETRVGILLERSVEMLVALLGVLKSGGAYVPLDPAYPSERLQFMLADAQVAVLLTEQRLSSRLPTPDAHVIYLDKDSAELSAAEVSNPHTAVVADNLAYVIYTSGSTGTPKGVAITHRSAATILYWAQEVFSAEQLRGVLASTSICFDLSVFEIFLPLSVGGKVILARNALELPQLAAKDEVSLINTVPSAIAELIRSGGVPETVQTVNLAGEALKAELVKQIYEQSAVEQVWNLYGPTEDTTYSTYALIGKDNNGRVTIGGPIACSQAYLLDQQLEPVPVGITAELYLGGEGLARGYLGRPELTAEKFIPDPFGRKAGGRLYRTGDLARYLPDGNIEYLGRVDHQVKIRGYRIELGEVEARLAQHPSVGEAVVITREQAAGEFQLIAYVVTLSDAVEQAQLRSYLEEKLPAYMVPSAFVLLPEMPLTPNGKVDRKALARLDVGSIMTEESFVAPRNETEATVAAIWAEVLDLPQVGIYSDFFKLGGHSLRAARVISRLRKAFDVELPLRSLFEASTVAALAEKIKVARGAPSLALAPITDGSREQSNLPLSSAQQRLWFLDQLEPGNPFYNLPAVVYMSGRLNVEALEKAINEIVRRHEVLRSTFSAPEGRAIQRISDLSWLHIPLIELSNLSEGEKELDVQRLITDEARRPFDLAAGPLLRATLLKTAEREHVLLLTMHHIVSDGWSMGVLMREVGLLYVAYASGRPSPLPELPIQYADFAHWQQQWMQGEVLQRQLAYWQQQLAGAATILELPTDRPRPTTQTYRGASVRFELPAGLTQELNTLSRREGVTLFMVLLSAFVMLLNRYTDQDDILVGTPTANRNRSEIENLIGLFVNTLVLRAQLSPEISFLELVRQMREVTLGAYAHQDIPFEKLVDQFQLEREMSRSPLFQVMFALQNAPLDKVELPELLLKLATGDSGTSKFDLTLYVEESAGALVGTWEYSTDLFDESTIRRMTTHFRTLLEGIVSDPRRRLLELPILTDSERQQLLVEFNNTAVEFPQDVCLHELIEQQVARTPEQIALVFEEEKVSYRELNERANQLAHHLQSLGVKTESRVGILLERSVEMLVALLGVLKSGGAYVPLDPAYPSERLRFMLEDAQVSVLITQQRLAALLPSSSSSLLVLDEAAAQLGQYETSNPELLRGVENLAYVIYTSGSTGTPKGVAITHRSAATMLHWAREVFSAEQLRGVLASTSICFDLSVFEIFLPLSVGGKVILARNALELPQLAAKDEVSLINTVPSAIAELIRSGGVPETVQTVNLAGEALKAELVKQIYEQSAVEQVWNLYGPTEDTTYSTYALIGKGDGRVTIGRPIACSQVYLLDQQLEPVPVGITAELYLGGEGLARGYLGRPELTAEKFIPDPFGRKAGGRLYRTGDLARYLPDGNIEYLGRVDHQVKIRGYRIELGEVEARLAQHRGVRESVVVVRDDEQRGPRLVAYVEAEDVSASQLREHLRKELPEYMIPAQFVMLDQLPLTSNGKINRRALPEARPGRDGERQAWVAARTPAEETLAEIWSKVLGVDQVGINDNFFELGGDSILSIQIVTRAKQAGLEFEPKQLFQHQTVAELATIAKIRTASEEEQSIIEGPVPLTPIQRLFLERNETDPHHLNQSLMLEVRGTPEPEQLRQAIQHLYLHHDALRLRFVLSEAGWQQFNEGAAPREIFTRMDISDLPEDAQTTAMSETVTAVQGSLDLSNGPLLKAVLFERGAGRAMRLLLVVHDLVADSVSWRILLEDLQKVYAQLSRGEELLLGPKTSSFKQWAEKLVAYAGSVTPESKYWLNALGRRVSRLPFDYQDDNVTASTQSVVVKLDPEETNALLEKAVPAYRVQMDEVLLTAAVQSFKNWTGQPLLIDLEVHGREDLILELNLTRTVGCLSSVYPVLLDVDDEAMPGDALNSVKEQLHDIPGKGIGYGLLRYLSENGVAARLQELPAAEVRFNYVGQQLDQTLTDLPMFSLANEFAELNQSAPGRRGYSIEISGGIFDGQLQMIWTYSESLHRRSIIEQLAESFIEALRSLIEHCDAEEGAEVIPSDFPLARLDQNKLSKLARMIMQEDESDSWTA